MVDHVDGFDLTDESTSQLGVFTRTFTGADGELRITGFAVGTPPGAQAVFAAAPPFDGLEFIPHPSIPSRAVDGGVGHGAGRERSDGVVLRDPRPHLHRHPDRQRSVVRRSERRRNGGSRTGGEGRPRPRNGHGRAGHRQAGPWHRRRGAPRGDDPRATPGRLRLGRDDIGPVARFQPARERGHLRRRRRRLPRRSRQGIHGGVGRDGIVPRGGDLEVPVQDLRRVRPRPVRQVAAGGDPRRHTHAAS